MSFYHTLPGMMQPGSRYIYWHHVSITQCTFMCRNLLLKSKPTCKYTCRSTGIPLDWSGVDAEIYEKGGLPPDRAILGVHTRTTKQTARKGGPGIYKYRIAAIYGQEREQVCDWATIAEPVSQRWATSSKLASGILVKFDQSTSTLA